MEGFYRDWWVIGSYCILLYIILYGFNYKVWIDNCYDFLLNNWGFLLLLSLMRGLMIVFF